MTNDSAVIVHSSLHAVAKAHIADRNHKEKNRDGDEYGILHFQLLTLFGRDGGIKKSKSPAMLCTNFQNFTKIAIVPRSSVLRRSGVNPETIAPAVPLLPPGGVIPPGPLQYGTLAWR